MCTVKEIQEAIQEDCKSQHDMDSTDIDRVMQTLPFAQEEPFTEARPRKPLFWFYSPDTENPYMDKPDTEKPAELNIEKSNTEKSITYGSSTDSIPFRETAAARPPERKGRDAMSVTEIENYRELILENIEYDC